MKVGIVAGEKSGDYLGAELIKAIRARHSNAEFIGLCGPLMQEQGGVSLAQMETISIMGLEGLLGSVREILGIRKKIRKYMLDWQPDVFIGIDVPDFNLALEIKLKNAGIPTVHYVSPTVWAWRGGRINKIKRAINLMLTLFPFEEAFYQQHDTPVKYVGHPLAKPVLQWQVQESFRQENVVSDKRVIAILPGSRMSEASRLAPIMLEAVTQLSVRYPDLQFLLPAANDKIRDYLKTELQVETMPVRVVDGHSRDVLALSDVAILASGTAALEAALFAKPMVVMYKVSKLTEMIASRTMVVEHYSMPNHLTSPPAVKELTQEQATVENLLAEVGRLLDDKEYYQTMQTALAKVAPALNENSGELACIAIEELIAK
ncbi:MAG: lipid-A-disaccharide synthase [Cryomorphaceae bacterium]|jgi:lipid-A-disaccharide synthase